MPAHFIPCGRGNIARKVRRERLRQRAEVATATYSRLANYFDEGSAYNGNLREVARSRAMLREPGVGRRCTRIRFNRHRDYRFYESLKRFPGDDWSRANCLDAKFATIYTYIYTYTYVYSNYATIKLTSICSFLIPFVTSTQSTNRKSEEGAEELYFRYESKPIFLPLKV